MRIGFATRIMWAVLGASVVRAALADDARFSGAMALDDSALEQVRGGFEVPQNLRASLSLDRAAYVNGALVVGRNVQIPDIGNMTHAQATALADAMGSIVIQNGPDNAFNVADIGSASTVIQNTLSNQHLAALTTLTVEVNTLGAFRETNFHDGLQQLINTAGGTR